MRVVNYLFIYLSLARSATLSLYTLLLSPADDEDFNASRRLLELFRCVIMQVYTRIKTLQTEFEAHNMRGRL